MVPATAAAVANAVNRRKERGEGRAICSRALQGEMFSADSWMRLEVLKGIEREIYFGRAVVILNLFFCRQEETTQNGGVKP